MILFLILYFLIYGSMHLYFFLHFKWAMSPGYYLSAAAGIWMVFMVSAPVLTRICEKKSYFTAARALAWTGYSWLGFLFLMVVLLLVLDIWNLLAHAFGTKNVVAATIFDTSMKERHGNVKCGIKMENVTLLVSAKASKQPILYQ